MYIPEFPLKTMEGLLKMEVLELGAGSRRQSPATTGFTGSQLQPAEMGFGPLLGSHPSTRTGDQDDVSSEQTPLNQYFRCF